MFIIGIEPSSPGLNIFSQTRMPRLGLPQLLTIARDMGHECLMYCEDIAPIDWEKVSRADMILISSITSTIPRAYTILKKIRDDVNPNASILMGGPHVTFLAEEALDNGADYVFRHEADESFPDFLQWWQEGKNSHKLLNIPGLSFMVGDKYHHTPPPRRVDLNILPTPDLNLIQGINKPYSIPMITSRGCPWNCDFCSEVAMFGRAYRFRSENKVIEDLLYYDRLYGKLPVFIADDNLGANKPRLERFCRGLIENEMTRSFSGQIRLDLANDTDLLKLMYRAGFERAYIGYESTNSETLEAVGKGLNRDDMARYTRAIHRQGIEIHAMWVLGFDTDTLETVKNNVRASIKWNLETSQFLILVPIPGSELYDKLKEEKRIFNHDWSKYDGHHVTFFPLRMAPRQLQMAVMLDAMPKLYNYWQTGKIFIAENWRNARAIFRIRSWHPFRRLKGNLLTLFVRLWGRGATHKMKRPIRSYLKQLPMAPLESKKQGVSQVR